MNSLRMRRYKIGRSLSITISTCIGVSASISIFIGASIGIGFSIGVSVFCISITSDWIGLFYL